MRPHTTVHSHCPLAVPTKSLSRIPLVGSRPLSVCFMHVQGSYLWRNCPELCLHRIPGQDDLLVSFHELIFSDMLFKTSVTWVWFYPFDTCFKYRAGCVSQNTCHCHSVTSSPTENIIDCIIFFGVGARLLYYIKI